MNACAQCHHMPVRLCPKPTNLHSIRTQACNGYPESGVCDASTWRLLLGQDAQPAVISQLRSGQSDDEDLGQQVGWPDF